MSNSGPGARIAGEAIGASLYLPTMATDEFLSCLSRQALKKAATTEGVRVEARVRDTRAQFVERFSDTRYVYPGALLQFTAEIAADATVSPNHLGRSPSAITNNGFDDDAGTSEDIVSDTDALAASAIAELPPVD
jgi:ParB family chromosome partitioning protein